MKVTAAREVTLNFTTLLFLSSWHRMIFEVPKTLPTWELGYSASKRDNSASKKSLRRSYDIVIHRFGQEPRPKDPHGFKRGVGP